MLNKENYRELYLRHAEMLVRQFYYKCGDQSAAEDLVQDAFVKLWQNREAVSEDKAIGYVYTVANRLFLDQKKREKVKLRFKQRRVSGGDVADPQFLLEEKQFAEKLQSWLESLPDGAREAFLLSRVEKLTYREIAARLGISQKAVEKRIAIALGKLRQLHKKI